MISLSELGEHRNDPSQHCLTLCVLSSSQDFAGFETVLNRCAFQRRAASALEEAAPIDIGPLTVAFGDVQRDRHRAAAAVTWNRYLRKGAYAWDKRIWRQSFGL